jgi:GH25 family lysozyme M1 (1,4-beta-N-acetylmuramidase)
MASPGNGSVGFRVLTANVQSVPEHAITLAQAHEDLRKNADAADLVLLQEIADRYRPLVKDAFPTSDWEVYYGADDNHQPIAFRREMFRKLKGSVRLLHPANHFHARRYTTYLMLRAEASGVEFHVTNLHMVTGAFSNKEGERALRFKEWQEGIAKHRVFVDSLVETGQPVIGGGDYNARLLLHPALGPALDGRPVKYAVDPDAIDQLWCIDGNGIRWNLLNRMLFPKRDAKKLRPERNSDHGARLATVELSPNGRAGIPFYTPGKPGHGSSNGTPAGTTKPPRKPKPPQRPQPPKSQKKWPPALQRTEFGDTKKYVVDWKTRAALEEAERRLGYTLTLFQGSYNTTVKASGGTHDGGGVVDLAPADHEHKVKVLRAIGFAAWYRPKTVDWDPHIHAVLVGHEKLSPEAQRQVVQYRNGTNGLKSRAPDATPRPNPVPVFQYPPKGKHGPGVDRPASPAPDQDPPGGGAGRSGSAFPPRRSLDGVDTSHHQAGRIDLRKAQHAGLRWWYVKTTEGESHVDDTYRKRVKEARKAGVPVGSYHFARPDGGDAVKEAQHFLKNAEIRLGDMVPMLDLEAREVLSRADLTKWVGVWVTTVRRELARRGLVAAPIIYTPFDLDDAFGCKLWVARYSNDFREPRIPQPWNRAAIWQHSDGKVGPIRNVPGFGAVDVNAMHPDLPLSALRVHKPRGADDVDRVRRDIQVAMKRLDDALERLPERKN